MCFGCYTQHVINILGFKYYVKLEAVMQVSDCGAPPSLVQFIINWVITGIPHFNHSYVSNRMPKTPNQRLRHLCRSSYSIAFGIPIAYWVDFSVFHVAADFPHYISQCILKFSILKCLSCLDFLIFLNFKCHIMEKFSEYLKTKDCRTS